VRQVWLGQKFIYAHIPATIIYPLYLFAFGKFLVFFRGEILGRPGGSVSQIIVFCYKEIGGIFCAKHRRNGIVFYIKIFWQERIWRTYKTSPYKTSIYKTSPSQNVFASKRRLTFIWGSSYFYIHEKYLDW
jgi:hypothetical protein